MVVYRKSNLDDVRSLAGLHRRYIPWGFLTSLGEEVLKYIYHSLVAYPQGVVIVAEEGGKLVGFVSGVKNLKEYYIFFFKKYFFKIIPHLFLKISFIRKMAETLMYAGKRENDVSLPSEELLAIVVAKDYQGRKIAQGLFDELRKWFNYRGVSRFKTTVGESNLKSIKFFRNLGWKESGQEEIHRGQRSIIFVWEGDEL